MRSLAFISAFILLSTGGWVSAGHKHHGHHRHKHGCCLPQPGQFAGYHPTCWRRWPDPTWGCPLPKRLAPVPPSGPAPTRPDETPTPGEEVIPPESPQKPSAPESPASYQGFDGRSRTRP